MEAVQKINVSLKKYYSRKNDCIQNHIFALLFHHIF